VHNDCGLIKTWHIVFNFPLGVKNKVRFFTIILVLCITVGCGSQPKKASTSLKTPQPRELMDINQLLSLANNAEPAMKKQYLINAFDLAISSRQFETAASIIQRLPLTIDSDIEVQLSHAKWQFTIQQYARSLDILRQTQLHPNFEINNSSHNSTLQLLMADNYLALGNLYESFSIRTQLNSGLLNEQRQKNSDIIWQTLTQMSAQQLSHFSATTYRTTEAAWLDLALISKQTYISPTQFVEAVERWQLTYPSHQQEFVLPQSVVKAIQAKPLNVSKVALILPLTGPLKSSAEAIRDGFINALMLERSNIELIVLDSIATDFREKLLSLPDQNVEFIIGPLRKEMIVSVSREQLPIPMIALNHVGNSLNPQLIQQKAFAQKNSNVKSPDADSSPQSFDGQKLVAPIFQFGLPAEDDADAMVKLTQHLDFKKALLFMPGNSRGKRIAEHYTKELLKNAGIIVDTSFYNKVSDIEKKVEQILGVKASEERTKYLQSIIEPDLIGTPRRRQDVDVILLSAPPSLAITIKPYLNLHYAHDIPVIADSTIYNEARRAENNKDLNSVYFVDIPFAIDNSEDISDIKNSLPNSWNDKVTAKAHLYALGFDSFKIIRQLPLLQNFADYRYPGLTGKLHLDHDGVVKRELLFAQFKQGLAEKIVIAE
jgi:uncharacterized protein